MKKVIALDIGGTNTRVALVNEAYEIESELIYDTVGRKRVNAPAGCAFAALFDPASHRFRGGCSGAPS